MTVIKNLLLFACLSICLSAFAESKAPDFTLGSSKSGKQINLSSYRGKTVYLDFWASWCIPCKDSFPWMNEMQAKYKKHGLIIVAVNLDEDKKAAKQFLKKIPAKFAIIYDPKGKVATKYNVEVMPTSYLIDKNGTITNKKLGFKLKNRSKMEESIKKALGLK